MSAVFEVLREHSADRAWDPEISQLEDLPTSDRRQLMVGYSRFPNLRIPHKISPKIIDHQPKTPAIE